MIFALVYVPARESVQCSATFAAISISGPLSALDLGNRQQELAQIVIEAADSISIALGYTVGGMQSAPVGVARTAGE